MRWCNSSTIRVMRSWAEVACCASCAISACTSLALVALDIGEILSQALADVHRYVGNTFDTGCEGKTLRMNGRCQSTQSVQQGGRGCIQVFVKNAVDSALLCRPHPGPAAIAEDLFQRHPVTHSTPGGYQHIRILLQNGFDRCLCARSSHERAAGRMNQLCNPGLGCDQRFTPLFAEDPWARLAGGA